MSSILLELKNNIAFVTLNRPEKFNAFNREMALTLQKVLDECENNNSVRCVFIRGAGKAFCAGQDLAEIADPAGPGMNKILSEHYNPIINKIRKLNKPVVAAVNGVAAGAGANVALCCDVVIAAQSASFIQAFSKIGLIPDSSGTFFLPRLVGLQKASAFMMLGDKIDAEEAQRIGMIYKFFLILFLKRRLKKLQLLLLNYLLKALHIQSRLLINHCNKVSNYSYRQKTNFSKGLRSQKDFQEGVSAFLEKENQNLPGNKLLKWKKISWRLRL